MEEGEVKLVIRGILISNPSKMTVRDLSIDFRKTEGMEVPFRKYGFNSFLEYLQSIPDTVVLDKSSQTNPVVIPVKSEKSSHIDSLVMRQKITTNKKSLFRAPPGRRKSAVVTSKPPLLPTPSRAPVINHLNAGHLDNNSRYKDTNSSSANAVKDDFISFSTPRTIDKVEEPENSSKPEAKFIPWNIVNLINQLSRKPQGCSFAEIEQELRSDLIKAGINEIHEILDDLKNYFEIRDGRVYRSYTKSPNDSSINASSSMPSSQKMSATAVAAAVVAAESKESELQKNLNDENVLNFEKKIEEFYELKFKLLKEEHERKMQILKREKKMMEKEHKLKMEVLEALKNVIYEEEISVALKNSNLADYVPEVNSGIMDIPLEKL